MASLIQTSCNSSSATGLNFDLSDEQKEIQTLTRKFVRDEIIPVAAQLDKTGEYPWQIVKKAHEIGLLNTHIPTELGE